ncbi:hypothetical protein ABZU25_33865 [Micromonospora sp. NPDC005215]|uniref:hypothetical protein n=1 Tax=Micromonospora sp. NPDC005215 TaxID=3157024 RepID=UPI0033B5D24B
MARHRPPEIRTGPVHRRDWRAWGRRCVCGLPWRCPDAGRVPPLAEPRPARVVGVARVPRRAGGTCSPEAGRAGWLTLAAEWRANGGRWDGIDRAGRAGRSPDAGGRR